MAAISMTGFGSGGAEGDGVRVEVEIVAVNRKQFDFLFAAPPEVGAFERVCRERVSQRISRGRIQMQVSVRAVDGSSGRWDLEAVRAQVDDLRRLAREVGLSEAVTLRDLLGLPDFNRAASRRFDPAVLERLLMDALAVSLERLCEMRRIEGAALAVDLRNRLDALRAHRDDVAAAAAEVPRRHQEILRRRIAELGVTVAIDDPVLAREVALCADRSDVTEELTRLTAHVDHVLAVLAGAEPCGRKLDFLCQEMHREVNTIGSKAGDASIAAVVIEMKALVETIREQVQNLE